jgi:hypothetical protein
LQTPASFYSKPEEYHNNTDLEQSFIVLLPTKKEMERAPAADDNPSTPWLKLGLDALTSEEAKPPEAKPVLQLAGPWWAPECTQEGEVCSQEVTQLSATDDGLSSNC